MNSDLEKQLDEVYMSKENINAYLYAKDELKNQSQLYPNIIQKRIHIIYE